MNESGVTVQIAPGELIDKITILEIKVNRLARPQASQNVAVELELLRTAQQRQIEDSERLQALTSELRSVNEILWDIEDAIRDCESRADFGDKFVELARSVYRNNDRRAELKRQINQLLGSRLMEEKLYRPY